MRQRYLWLILNVPSCTDNQDEDGDASIGTPAGKQRTYETMLTEKRPSKILISTLPGWERVFIMFQAAARGNNLGN